MGILVKLLSWNWMTENAFDDKSTLGPVMAWCDQATSHYQSHFDPDLRRHMAPLGHNELMV